MEAFMGMGILARLEVSAVSLPNGEKAPEALTIRIQYRIVNIG